MAIALANTAKGTDTSSATNTAATTAISTTTGNLLVAFGRASTNGKTMSIADTAGNTWTSIVAATDNTGLGDFAMWYAKNITGNASNVVTITWSANCSNKAAMVLEYSGCDTSAPLDATPTLTNTVSGTATVTSGSFSTVQADEVIVFAVAYDNGTALTAGLIGGVTATKENDTLSAATGLACEDLIVSSTQSAITAAMSSNGAGPWDWLAQVATFKAAAASGGSASTSKGTLAFMGAG